MNEKKFFFGCAALVLAPALYAAFPLDADVPEMPARFRVSVTNVLQEAQGVTKAAYPNDDVVIVDDHIHTWYDEEGRDATWDDEWLVALTERGRRDLSTVEVHASRRYGDAAILLVEIYGTNGVRRTVDIAATLKEATDNGGMSANIYDPMDRRITCSVPGLQIGEMRHVITCYRQLKSRMKGAWSDRVMLETDYASVRRFTVSVEGPNARPILQEAIRNRQESVPLESKTEALAGDRFLKTWTMKDMPLAFDEPRMPAASECLQSLRLSTLPDWRAVSKWYAALCEPHLTKTHAGMTNKVSALIAEAPDAESKIRAIFKFVSQEVRYMGLTLEDTSPGYEPHDVDVTFDNRYGVCRDKAALLVALLRIAGFEAYPTLIHAGAKMDPTVPSPYFNHAIVAVVDRNLAPETGYLLMDPTNEATSDLCPSYLSNRSYLPARADGETILLTRAPAVEKNLMTVKSSLTLATDGSGVGVYEGEMRGINDNRLRDWFVSITPASRNNQFQNIIQQALPSATLLSLDWETQDFQDTSRPLRFKATLKFSGLLSRGETGDAFTPPFLSPAFSLVGAQMAGAFSLDKRRFPLTFMTTVGTREEMSVETAGVLGSPLAKMDEVRVGDAAHASDEAMGYSFHRTAAQTGSTLQFTREELLTGLETPAPRYAALRAAYTEAAAKERETFRFVSGRAAEAATRIISSRSEIGLLSPTSWVVTNTLTRQALTYEGARALSEIRYPYNPAVLSVEFVSGVVSNRDGTVRTVKAHEINEMDQDWVGRAPRYPNGKIKVVSLPGVEIGSIISTVSVRAVTNAPYAFNQIIGFHADNPVEAREYIVHAPKDLEVFVRSAHLDATSMKEHPVETAADGTRTWRWTVKNSKPLPREWNFPHWRLWESLVSVRVGAGWRPYAERFAASLREARRRGSEQTKARARALTASCKTSAEAFAALHRFATTAIRQVAIPDRVDLPYGGSLSTPDRVLAEGYASEDDLMNFAYALYEAAGFKVDFRIAAFDDANIRDLARQDREDGFLEGFYNLYLKVVKPHWWGPDEVFYHALSDTPYDPVGVAPAAGCTYIDLNHLCTGIGEEPVDPALGESENRLITTRIEANGDATIEVDEVVCGVSAGARIKEVVETPPEYLRREFRARANRYVRGAEPVGDETFSDSTAYPFRHHFALKAERMATCSAGVMSVTAPATGWGPTLPLLGFGERALPLAVLGFKPTVTTWRFVFPAGWTELEEPLANWEFKLPGEETCRARLRSSSRWVKDHLEVDYVLETFACEGKALAREYALWLREARARLMSARKPTVRVRRRTAAEK